jgi:hemerythrin
MSLLRWTQDYSIGVAAFDAEHMQLMAMANGLYEAILSGTAEDTLNTVFERLVRFTETHFSAEEEMFRLTNFPEAGTHTESHERLKEQVLAFREHVGKVDRTLLAIEVTKFLKQWFVEHIQGDDRVFGRFLNTKGIR